MKNVIKIIESDIKRLSVNVVAMVVIIGLTVIPCLYAWFNILSNWDPYGPDATKNLQVAVASSDQGILVGNYELNVGDIIISNLKENTSIGWVFTDTAEDAISGVHSGDYYAALVIDEEFSADMISFLGGEIENPKITYYENDKKNAIAPKITGKVKTAIEREVDHAFVSTMAETLLSASEYFATVDEQGNITGQGIEKLEQLDSDLKGMIILLDSYIAVIDSTESIVDAGEAIADSADSIVDLAENSATIALDDKLDNAVAKENAQVSMANKKFDEVDSLIRKIKNYVNKLNYIYENADANKQDPEDLKKQVNDLKDLWDKQVYPVLPATIQYTDKDGKQATKTKEELNEEVQNLIKESLELIDQSATTEAEFNQKKEKVLNDLDKMLETSQSVRAAYISSIEPTEQAIIDSATTSVTEIENLLNYDATSIDAVVASLQNYGNLMGQSRDSLVKSRNEAVEMEEKLAALISDIKNLNESESYQKFLELVKTDPELLSDFISSPVEISDEYIYAVENNGSMTAPFYMVLSIWVGALIMSTILKTTVKDTTGMENLKNWECFFGRFFTTFVIGQIQTLITVLGAFLFVGIQCEHHFLLWLACAWTSLVYSLLMYSFAYSFGNVGEALSVILMVIQVAGAGGTFPIEVLPKVFQVLYKFMPFNYSMNAVRECIGGLYENTYRNCMLTLIIYVVIAVFIGVVLYHPFKVLNEKIEHSKEKSGILL